MRALPAMPVALTIAGSDSGGGAGIQADLRVFTLLGVHGATAITCLTAQNRRAVSRIEPTSPAMLRAQLEAVFAAESPPRAAKTGMLYSSALIREVARFLARHPRLPLVIDPVMIATSGRPLLQPGALKTLTRDLLPKAALITPNRHEAEVLSGRKIISPEDMRAAARHLHAAFGCAILIKGGHVPNAREALDILFDGQNEWLLIAPRARRVRLHGTGCAYSAAITAALAHGKPLPAAVALGKKFITQAIHRASAIS